MKIKIDDIPDNGLSMDVTEDAKAFGEIGGDFSLADPVKAHLDITRSGALIRVQGNVDTVVKTVCARCLEDFEFKVSGHFSNRVLRGKEEKREKELTKDDIETNYLEGDFLDTIEIISEEIALEFPIRPLCKEDCKGLCPYCGADLNKETCLCETHEKVDKRFEKLKGFKVKK